MTRYVPMEGRRASLSFLPPFEFTQNDNTDPCQSHVRLSLPPVWFILSEQLDTLPHLTLVTRS